MFKPNKAASAIMQLVKGRAHYALSHAVRIGHCDPHIALCLHMNWKPDAGVDDHGADKAHSHFILF